jgi:hypothetical protein
MTESCSGVLHLPGNELRFNIGETVIALRSETMTSTSQECFSSRDQGFLPSEPDYQKFISTEKPHAVLSHRWGEMPELESWDKVFDSHGVWRLYQKTETSGKDLFGIALHSPVFGSKPYQVAILEKDFQRGEIISSADYFPVQQIPFPLRYPLAEIIMINLLAQGRGALLHACGVKIQTGTLPVERGLLFAGVSGAGKSTTARLWQGQKNATLLSDDRVILRKKDNDFWIYGTPWHGDAGAAAAEAVPLTHIFILEHAASNQVRRLAPADLATRLFIRSFPTFWDRRGIEYSLQILDELSQAVPGYALGFVPDSSAVDFINDLINRPDPSLGNVRN